MHSISYQKSRAAINDIELHVRQIEGTARKYYSQVELDPFLRDLEDHVRDTAGVMEGLGKELECKQARPHYVLLRSLWHDNLSWKWIVTLLP